MTRPCARAAIAIAAAFSVTTASAAFTCTASNDNTQGMRLVATGANAGSGPGAGVRNPNIYNLLTSYPWDNNYGILGGGKPLAVNFTVEDTNNLYWYATSINMTVRFKDLRTQLASLLKGDRLPPTTLSMSPITEGGRSTGDLWSTHYSYGVLPHCSFCGQLEWQGNDLVWHRTYRTEREGFIWIFQVAGDLAFRIYTDDPKGFQFKPSAFNREFTFNSIETSCTIGR